ncbi:hypothetical protein PAXINDRAFT_167177 [Paxillus involutus ATCC 200175]|nr:hypothetical protein PAXINDRAFT_167177 [Paxillus involutus ATCC 200175]
MLTAPSVPLGNIRCQMPNTTASRSDSRTIPPPELILSQTYSSFPFIDIQSTCVVKKTAE